MTRAFIVRPFDEKVVWLRSVDDFGIWQHNNLWLLHSALAHGAEKVVLIALWNGTHGGGPGGTEHLVTEVKRLGGRCEVLDARVLVAGTGP